MSVLAAEKVRHLSLGVHGLDEVFSGFELGEFVVLYGNDASSMSFTLSVRSQLPAEHSRLGSATVFVDGGNLFSPYAIAETARNCGLDYSAVLNRVYVSRAFTAYQFASLISEKLRSVLKKTRAQLLIVSNITSLLFDRDLSRTEARALL